MKKISLIAALVLGGLVACCTLAHAQDTNSPDSSPKKEKGGKRGFMSPEQRLEMMSTELSLTDAQKPKVKDVLEDTSKQMRDIPQDERREKGPAIREAGDKKLKEILTPDQWEKYQKMMQSMGKKKKKSSE